MYESTAFGGMVGGGLGLTISATATREETVAQTEGAGVNVGVALPAGPIAGVDLPLSTPESSYKLTFRQCSEQCRIFPRWFSPLGISLDDSLALLGRQAGTLAARQTYTT